MNRSHVTDQLFRRQNRNREWGEEPGHADHDRGECGLQPLHSQRENALDGNATSRKQHRVGWSEIIILAVHDNEFGQCNQIGESERAITLTFTRDE